MREGVGEGRFGLKVARAGRSAARGAAGVRSAESAHPDGFHSHVHTHVPPAVSTRGRAAPSQGKPQSPVIHGRVSAGQVGQSAPIGSRQRRASGRLTPCRPYRRRARRVGERH